MDFVEYQLIEGIERKAKRFNAKVGRREGRRVGAVQIGLEMEGETYMKTQRRLWGLTILLAVVLAACSTSSDSASSSSAGRVSRPDNAIDISIIYAPESDLYMPQVIEDFNRAYANGNNPITGAELADGERPIFVTGEPGSSGTVAQGIVNAVIAPNNQNVARPTIFQPSVSHWLALANFQSGRQLFDMSDVQATALAPVVMAIWESRLEAIQNTVGYEEIGWEELLGVLNSPNGWQDFGIPNGRRTVYYGHTDPFISSTALSTLIAEFYASARQNGFTGRRLTLNEVNDPAVQNGVRNIENLIRHYSRRTTEFKEYIVQGTGYLDFVALEENDLLFINMGRTEIQPPEKLVALYPKEGTFWHEHPFGIVNADWTTQEQRDAARIFTEYVLTPDVQRLIMSQGFRPANPDVPLDFPFVEQNGIDPAGPSTILDVPAPETIAAIQQSWSFVKKQADIMLLIDVSGSMSNENKLAQAQQAANAFLDGMEPNNRVGLTIFADNVSTRVPLNSFETNEPILREHINLLNANGGTALYSAIREVVVQLDKDIQDDRIRAVVLLSDGENTAEDGVTLNDAVQAIAASSDELNPVIVIPVAYGSNADINALSSIARASATTVQAGDPENILNVLEIISSYF
ncbi:MAG: VWA domain-containing protein [Chloroflexi bacterium]|nr:MAG: VWA domain-containing protein [Chloroflexota bacterium]